MLGRLIEGVFGCRHSRCSFPVTIRRGTRRNDAASLTGTYVVCLGCGKEFPYDWKEMKVVAHAAGSAIIFVHWRPRKRPDYRLGSSKTSSESLSVGIGQLFTSALC